MEHHVPSRLNGWGWWHLLSLRPSARVLASPGMVGRTELVDWFTRVELTIFGIFYCHWSSYLVDTILKNLEMIWISKPITCLTCCPVQGCETIFISSRLVPAAVNAAIPKLVSLMWRNDISHPHMTS